MENIFDEANLHFMCDLETLGTATDTVILSSALVPFGCVENTNLLPFYAKLDFTKHCGGTISTDTIKWWMQQSEEAREESFSGEEALEDALNRLTTYVIDSENLTKCTSVSLWGNGADFDCKILEHAYESCGIQFPFSFRDFRCFRTLRALFQAVTAPTFMDIRHTAIGDAKHEAAHADKIFNTMRTIL